MKKLIILFAFFALFFGQKGFSQTWNTTSPKIIYAVDSLGDTANVKVGIGTANPQDKLDIAGNVKVKGQLTVDSIVTPVIAPVDSEIRFGHDAILFNMAANIIHWTNGTRHACCSTCFVGGLGIGNTGTFALADDAMAIGTHVQVGCAAPYAIVMGSGCVGGPPLINNLTNTLMVGFNSDIPTFYVGPSPCAGTGMVGIGTTAPITALHVANSPNVPGFITTDPLAPAFLPVLAALTDGIVVANTNGTLNRKINFTGSATDVLLGNGEFGPISGGNVTSCAAGTTNYIPKYNPGPFDICNSIMYDNGTAVGVNTITPLTEFHVAGPAGLITTDPLAPPFLPVLAALTDGITVANTNGTLNRKINFTGSASDVLLGNGEFGPMSGGNVTSCAAGTTNYITKYLPGPNDICNSIMYDNGTAVGVNTTTPLTEFHVAGPNGFITTDPLSAIFLPTVGALTDGLVIADLNGTLNRKINLTGVTTDVLRGDGTFGPGGGTGNLSSCAITPAQVNYLPKYTIAGPNPTVCLSQVFDNGTNVLVNAFLPLYGYDRMEVWGLDQFSGVPATGLLGSVYPNNTGLNIPSNYGLEGYLDLKRHALTNIGVDAEVYSNTTSYQNIGVNSIVTGTNDGASYSTTGAQMGVQVHSYGNALSSLPTYTIFNYGVESEADDATACYGGDFYANGSNAIIPPPAPWVLTQTNGVNGRASGAQWNIGVTGSAVSNVNGIDDEGVYGIAASFNCLGGQVFGGKFETFCPTASCSSPSSGTIYGVFAYAPPTSGPPSYVSCLPNTWNSYAGFFNGDLVYTGNFYTTSDSTIKDSVKPIKNALATLSKLQPESFVYNNIHPEISSHGGQQYGLIAQAVQRVLPNLVDSAIVPARYDSLGNVKSPRVGVLALNYVQLIPFLIEGVNEQQKKITTDSLLMQQLHHTDSTLISKDSMLIQKLFNILSSYQACLDSLCGQGAAGGGNAPHRGNGGNGTGGSNESITNVQDVTLSSVNAPLLYQNIPNPFTGNTKINYYLPDGTMGASIVFYDSYGNQIKEVQLSQTGNGTLNITPDNLTNGIYSYSLVVNGKVIDTKRMILSR